ncbi:MAG: T9SS type A sorting domain-containing protein, partial [candidate division KSB1 bacterium]|nr:T9SS type A sorting domain-containing protein [candidate division KSB1 bacterium]
FGKSYPIPNTFADARGAINDQQDIIVDVQNMRGSSIVIKPEINGLPIEEEQFSYALGHIYIEKDKTLPKPLPPDLRILEPETFALFQNYPNPFNPETEICYQLAQDTHVTLKIYNLLGQEVRTLVDKEELAGHYTVRWNGKDENGLNVASGVYLYHITMGNFMATRKMILLR